MSSCFSWEVNCIHTALSTLTFEHDGYFTKSAFTVSHSLTHTTAGWHVGLKLACFNCGDIFWGEFDRTHKWGGIRWDQVGPGTSNSGTTCLMEGQHWNHTLNRIKSLTQPRWSRGAVAAPALVRFHPRSPDVSLSKTLKQKRAPEVASLPGELDLSG